MSLLLFAVAALCTVNAPRARSVVPVGDDARAIAALGAAMTVAGLTVVAIVAEPLLDLVHVSDPSARLATGLLLVATGVLMLGSPDPDPEPALPGRRAALVPVAFPTLFTPGLAALTVSAAVDLGAVVAVAGVAVALATLPLVISTSPEPPVRHRVFNGLARFLAGLLVAVGVALLFNGVFDI